MWPYLAKHYHILVRGPSQHPATPGRHLVRGRAGFPPQDGRREDRDHCQRGAPVPLLLLALHDPSQLLHRQTDEETLHEVLDSRFVLLVLFV